MQESGERFDTFLVDVRRLARSCQFEGIKESMIRDRIVVGIRDENTRHKLLDTRPDVGQGDRRVQSQRSSWQQVVVSWAAGLFTLILVK